MTVSFNAADAAAFVPLASQAELDLSDLFLNPPWKLIQTFRSTSASHPQGFVAMGPLPSSPATKVAIVALGVSWSDFIETYLATQHTLSFPPNSLFPANTGGVPLADLGYTNMYNSVRTALWTAVLFAKRTIPDFANSMPLVVCGIGPGAPLAQFAAVDLLPAHVWNGNTSPITSVTAYTYSNVAFGNQDFADAVNKNVPAAFAVNLKTNSGIVVDPYPLSPGNAIGYYLAGQQTGANGKLPPNDCPWLERSPGYYSQILGSGGGIQSSATPRGQRRGFSAGVLAARQASITTAPSNALSLDQAGYTPTLAYTLTLLDLAAYQRALHPDLPYTPPAPYVFAADIKANGINWGSIYVSPDRVVAAFRGTATWQETVDAWGTAQLTRPSWLSVDGDILVPPSNLYDALRDNLRSQLVAINQSNLPLVISGHDTGGSLASLAMLDLTLNPQAGAPAANAVYTFGAPPLGNVTFSNSFNTKVGANSFQVVRTNDIIPQLVFGAVSFAITMPTQIVLQGGADDPSQDATFHTLTSYSALLNPQAISFKSSALTEDEVRYYEEGKGEQIRINEVTKCVVDSANGDGRILFSWEAPQSKIPPKRSYERGEAFIGVMQTIVRPGHEMVIEAPQGQKVNVVATELILSPGSTVRIATNARLHVSRLTIAEPTDSSSTAAPPRIIITGADGPNGSNGINGMPGMNGAPRQPGGSGSQGGSGSPGFPGINCPNADFSFDTISGTFVIYTRGGAGGNGGNGGAGGNGGIGGSSPTGQLAPGGDGGAGGGGGTGANAGNGGRINVTYRTLAPGADIIVEAPVAPGGEGGNGGQGGAGGRGQPSGNAGSPGVPGAPGISGRPSTVVINQV